MRWVRAAGRGSCATGSGSTDGRRACWGRSPRGIDVSFKDPEIELDGGRSRAIFAFAGGDCTQLAPVRGVLLDLAPGAPSVAGSARDYGTIAATITDAGSAMLSDFYLPGDPWGSLAVAFTTAP